jgi:hypothetical protein
MQEQLVLPPVAHRAGPSAKHGRLYTQPTGHSPMGYALLLTSTDVAAEGVVPETTLRAAALA